MISNIYVLTIFCIFLFMCFSIFMSFYYGFVYFLNCCKTYLKLHPACLFTVQSEKSFKYIIYKERIEHTNADTDWCPLQSLSSACSYFLVIPHSPSYTTSLLMVDLNFQYVCV